MAAYTDILFDLDGTLYPLSCGLLPEIGHRIGLYVAQQFRLEYEPARALARDLFDRYGLTVLGLQSEHGIDIEHYAAFVHDIDYARFIAHDPALDAALDALDARLSVFTNAPGEHTRTVLDLLGIAPRFAQIFDIEFAQWVPKPTAATYARVLEQLGSDPAQTVMIEDTARNLLPAKALGMTTVWIGDSPAPEGTDIVASGLVEALDLLRER